MSTTSSTTADNKNPIQKWGLSTDVHDLDTIMICLTTSHSGISNAGVTEVLRRRNPSKYGAITVKDVKDIFNYYFLRWNSAGVPWGVWADRYTCLKNKETVNEALTRDVEWILARAKDELGMGESKQGKADKTTQLVVERGVEDVGDREEEGCAEQSIEEYDEWDVDW